MKYFLFVLLFPLSLLASTKVSVLGDSISVGWRAESGKSYVNLLEERYTEEGKDIVFVNHSYIGATLWAGAYQGEIDQILINDKPDYLIIFRGINDVYLKIHPSVILSSLTIILQKATPATKRVILGGVNSKSVGPDYNPSLQNIYGQMIATFHPHPVMLEGLDVIAKTVDGVHPSDEGQKLIADYVYQALHEVGAY